MDISALIATVTTAVNGYKSAVETLDEAKIAAATNELMVQVAHLSAQIIAKDQEALQATERERALLRANDNLSNKVREFQERASELARYELVEDHPGTFTFRVKEVARNGEPVHHLCPGCLNNRAMKSILQFYGREKGHGRCLECKATYTFTDPPELPPARGYERI